MERDASNRAMLTKVLIANRGEIAVRVIRTCRARGIATVAVYSDADFGAMHVRMADQAVRIGPAPAAQSYLDIDAVLTAAQQTRADAVHPGYGFLSENADFARRVQGAGLTWIGPTPDIIELMGDKVEAKRLAEVAGLPTVPGYRGEDDSVERLHDEASRLGFPVLVKAAAGGGGRGMREVMDAAYLRESVSSARREAKAAFGDDRVFLEKLIAGPQHVEIQVLGDVHGNVRTLGERDCSAQRRHQKVIEEAPSPAIDPGLRGAMQEAAELLCRQVGYTSAGTVEFLVAEDRFYFLEMNTRIQVEHPVTEMVTGVDIVGLQIDVAEGKNLLDLFSPVGPRGHAIEARIYAEDPAAGFVPSTGRVTAFEPPHGSDLRNDAGVETGSVVTSFYDPMLAKLIAHGETRREAIDRLAGGLERYRIRGITTNIPFLQWILASSDFRSGRMSVDFIDRFWSPDAVLDREDEVYAAAACFEVLGNGFAPDDAAAGRIGGWRNIGIERSVAYAGRDGSRIVRVSVDLPAVRWSIGGGEWHRWLLLARSPELAFETADHRVLRVSGSLGADAVQIDIGDRSFRLPFPVVGAGSAQAARSPGTLAAPTPGTVVRVLVTEGDRVSALQPLVILEAMKMEHTVAAPYEGVVKAVHFKPGDLAPAGAALLELDPG